ncbi:cadmium transporter [Streptacidiphilus sp. PB12-B1b]|uniref:cadmium resistance transporter n=1 Tax=Streptacidiphilus sp. PB12-B1b TaxID=2705012 RepID=UPI0015FC7286|nr:cadmium resistance transporter [Streptacidiphilus sp. PB12-B1b]QMU76511.1 cadmium transporter [Streptacidiphilus sp. PB12-B1b]
MGLGMVVQAVGLFAATNVDGLLVLSLFFARGASRRGAVARTVIGQYLGFAAILSVSLLAASGSGVLPGPVRPLLGLIPLALGLRAAWQVVRRRRRAGAETSDTGVHRGPGAFEVAGVTLANGGDNVSAYVPVLAAAGTGGRMAYAAVFLVLVAVLCAVGRLLAVRPVVARTVSRWGHVLLPLVLVTVGLSLLARVGLPS